MNDYTLLAYNGTEAGHGAEWACVLTSRQEQSLRRTGRNKHYKFLGRGRVQYDINREPSAV